MKCKRASKLDQVVVFRLIQSDNRQFYHSLVSYQNVLQNKENKKYNNKRRIQNDLLESVLCSLFTNFVFKIKLNLIVSFYVLFLLSYFGWSLMQIEQKQIIKEKKKRVPKCGTVVWPPPHSHPGSIPGKDEWGVPLPAEWESKKEKKREENGKKSLR